MVYTNPFFYALNPAISKAHSFNFEQRKYTKVVKFRFNRTLLISGCSNFDLKHATKLVLRVLSYYQILGVSEDASLDDIKSAFKKQALKFHPDRNQEDPSAEELFKELNNAYQTLSNPYSRHKYDMTLKFGSFDIPQQPPTPPPPPFRRRPKRPFYKKVSLTSKENLRATMYAFLFAFFVGLFIKIGVWLTDYYKAVEKEKILTERREEFGKVQSAFNKGELKESLFMLDDMGMFFESELDMREYKDMLLNHVLTRANASMEEHRYKAALRYYEILDRFSIKNSLNILLNKAKAHKGLGNYQEAIAAYQLLFFHGYRSLSFYVDMGELYEDGFQDYESALNYYQKATNMAASGYESTYGKAYPVMINAEMIPKHHFDIFMKLANAHFMVGDYESAIRSVVWTKEIWPDSSKNYVLSGKSLLAQGKRTLACSDFLLAKYLDPTIKVPSICE